MPLTDCLTSYTPKELFDSLEQLDPTLVAPFTSSAIKLNVKPLVDYAVREQRLDAHTQFQSLMTAVLHDRLELFQTLLSSHVPVKIRCANTTVSVLHAIALHGRFDFLKVFFKQRPDDARRLLHKQGQTQENTTDEDPAYTPLSCAIAGQSVECALFLLQQKANVGTLNGDKSTSMMVALQHSALPPMLEVLKRAGASLNHPISFFPVNHVTLIYKNYALTDETRSDFLAFLGNEGVDLHAEDSFRKTALWYSCSWNHSLCVKTLMAFGVSTSNIDALLKQNEKLQKQITIMIALRTAIPQITKLPLRTLFEYVIK